MRTGVIMGRDEVDVPSLVAGLVIVALGALLLLDRLDVLDIGFGLFWPALLAAVGAILLASGLSGPRRPRRPR